MFGRLLGLWGVAEVRVVAAFPEKFINLAIARGMRVWDVRLGQGQLTFKTDIFSIAALAAVQQRVPSRVEIASRWGLAVWLQKLARRKMLVVGFFCFWLVLSLFSRVVWQIEIVGNRTIPAEEISEFVAGHGLRRWAALGRLDLDNIEQELYVKFPQIAWTTVDRQGTYVKITIVEKEGDPLQDEPIDIVAGWDGIITEMMVLRGTPLVQRGMTVAKGDVLIAGYRQHAGVVHAAGSVRALVFVEGYGEAALHERERVRTGNSFTLKSLQLGKFSLALTRARHGFGEYDQEETIRRLRGFPHWPIYLVEYTLHEVEIWEHQYTPQQARQLARQRALYSIDRQLPEDAAILTRTEEEITLPAEDIFRVRVVVKADAEIAVDNVQFKGD